MTKVHTFRLSTSNFTEMKTLLPTDDMLEKAFLLLARYDLILAIYVALVAGEVLC